MAAWATVPAAGAAPPVALGVGGDVGREALAVVLVEELDGDLVGVAVGRLHLVGVEARREEEHLLAPGRLQHLVDVGGHAAAAGERPEGRASPGSRSPGSGPAPSSPGSRSRDRRRRPPRCRRGPPTPPSGRRCSRSGRRRRSSRCTPRAWPAPCPRPPRRSEGCRRGNHCISTSIEPTSTFAEVDVEVGEVGGRAAEAVALGRQLGQGPGDVDEVLVGVPALAHALHVELEDGRGQPPPVEDAHGGDYAGILGLLAVNWGDLAHPWEAVGRHSSTPTCTAAGS